LIDEHLFVEAMALSALFAESEEDDENEGNFVDGMQDEDQAFDNAFQEDQGISSLEKVLRFIERLSNSEGIYKKMRQGSDLSS